MFASCNGNTVVVDKLLDKGANIEATNKVTYLISFQNLFKNEFDINVDRSLDVVD